MRWLRIAMDARPIFAKEVLCLARDRNTILYSVVLPFFLYPALIWIVLQIVLYLKGLEERSVPTVVGLDEAGGLVSRFLASEGSLRFLGQPGVPPGGELDSVAVREQIAVGEVDAAIVVTGDRGGGEAAPRDPPSLQAHILFSGARDASRGAADRLRHLLEDFRREFLEGVARASGLEGSFLEVLDVEETDLSSPQELANYVASLLLPLLMVFMTALGALYPALETSVGEKERGSLETTLVSPVSRASLVAGKYAAVALFALGAFLLNFISMSFTFLHLRDQFQLDAFRLSLGAAALVLCAAVLLALLLSALMMVLGFLARSFREGQSYVIPVYLLALVPTFVATSPSARLTPWLAALPVVNVALLFRDSLRGRPAAAAAAITLISSALYVAIAVLIASRLLRREELATGGEVPLPRLFAALFGRGGRREEA